ncbi:MAG: hypothetical protein QOJ79_2537 [Actinomycetota bacterium]|jgi:hypothetical protein|nr:hypothetical protein [Actinomycetota bacterium]
MRKLFGKTHQTDLPLSPATVATRALATRTDLTCSVCTHVIAYGVRPERVLADAGFFLDAHKPFCMGMRAAG